MNEINYDGYMLVRDTYDLITHESTREPLDTYDRYDAAVYNARKEFKDYCTYINSTAVWWCPWEVHDEERKIRYGDCKRPFYEVTFRIFKYKLIEV